MRTLVLTLSILTACAPVAEQPHEELTTVPGQTLTQVFTTVVDAAAMRQGVVDEGFPWPPMFASGPVTLTATGFPAIAHDHFPIAFTLDREHMLEREQDEALEAAALINHIAGRTLLAESDTGRIAVSVVPAFENDGDAGECAGNGDALTVRLSIAGEVRLGSLTTGVWFHEYMHALDFVAEDGDVHEQIGILAPAPTEFLVTARVVAYLRYLGGL
jgi:hypothetical protein